MSPWQLGWMSQWGAMLRPKKGPLGLVFAVNSSLHSFLILAYSRSDDDVALDVGFYYSANATGRLLGTLLSGVLYLWGGLDGALWGSAAFLVITWLLTLRLPALTTRPVATVSPA